jgi:hypothetical protein
MSLEMAHKVIVPPKKNYIPQFLKQQDINSYYTLLYSTLLHMRPSDSIVWEDARIVARTYCDFGIGCQTL